MSISWAVMGFSEMLNNSSYSPLKCGGYNFGFSCIIPSHKVVLGNMTFNFNVQAVAELFGIDTGIVSVFRATCRVLELGNAGRKTAHALWAKPSPWCTVTPSQREAHLFLPKKALCAHQALLFQGCDHPEVAPMSNSDVASNQAWLSSCWLVWPGEEHPSQGLLRTYNKIPLSHFQVSDLEKFKYLSEL